MDATQSTTGARGFGFLLMGEELLFMLDEARYAIILLVLLIIADFRYGRQESAIRYNEAKQQGDSYLMAKYKWHTSRAVRRSINKFLDYMLFALVGLFIGVQFLEPIDVSRIWGTYGAMAVIAVCEIFSIVGHFLFLHERDANPKGLLSFLRRFAVAIVKKRNREVGEALDEAIQEEANSGK